MQSLLLNVVDGAMLTFEWKARFHRRATWLLAGSVVLLVMVLFV